MRGRLVDLSFSLNGKQRNKATPGPWIDNGNEIVVPSNPNEGIAGALTDEDNAFKTKAKEVLGDDRQGDYRTP